MTEHILYGVKVRSDTPLFDPGVNSSALAPEDPRGLQLEGASDNILAQKLTICFPLYTTHGRDVSLRTDRELGPSASGQPWCMEISGVVSFFWEGGNSIIDYRLYEHGTPQLLVFWFVHIFLPLYLTLERGYDFIHCAAVEIDEKSVLFIAPSMGGKSTLGGYFLEQGHPMLSDDKAATFLREGDFFVVPSHPHHRPFRESEVLGYAVDNFAIRARPIHAFYLLERGEPDGEVEITEITGFCKFEELFPNYLYSFRFLQEQRLHWLAKLVNQSVVFRVRRPWSLDRMQEVYEAICDHSRNML